MSPRLFNDLSSPEFKKDPRTRNRGGSQLTEHSVPSHAASALAAGTEPHSIQHDNKIIKGVGRPDADKLLGSYRT